MQSDEHFTHDVLAGAAIGILSNYDLTMFRIPFGGTLTIAPLDVAPIDPFGNRDDAGSEPRAMVPGLSLKLDF